MKTIMKKLILATVVILLAIPFIYSYLAYNKIKVINKYADEFHQVLVEVVNNKTQFDMKDITPFDWDRMVVFIPYTSRKEMEEGIGQEWTTHSFLGYLLFQKTFLGDYPLDDDSLNKMIFLKGKKVVLDITFNRWEVDLTQITDTIYKIESKFIVDNRTLKHRK